MQADGCGLIFADIADKLTFPLKQTQLEPHMCLHTIMLH